MIQGMDAICSGEKCDRQSYAHGLCRMHYMRVRRHGDINRGKSVRQPCSAEDCNEPSDAKGMCHRHYEDAKRRARGAKVKAPRGSFTPCSEGDGEPVVGQGLCRTHYMRKLRKGTTDEKRKNARARCSDKDCDRVTLARGMCGKHYRAWQRETKPHYLQKRYLTADEKAVMIAEQGGVCAICRGPSGPKGWVTDHDHMTGAIRGLLCHTCNLGLGHFQDDPERLKAAIAYLER